MNKKVAKKFQQKLAPVAQKIKNELPDQNKSSMRSLAEIMLAWYERKINNN